MKRIWSQACAAVVVLGMSAAASASPVTIDFEGLADQEVLTSQIPGITLSNAMVVMSGASGGTLNELEFPPHSGTHVVFDDGGAMTISFAAPVSSVSGYFTYLARLTLEAYDDSNTLVGSVPSAFISNLLVSGDLNSTPNEWLGVSVAPGFSRVVIAGDPFGGSFTLDDLTFEPVTPNGVPEPASLLLVGMGLLGLRRKRAST